MHPHPDFFETWEARPEPPKKPWQSRLEQQFSYFLLRLESLAGGSKPSTQATSIRLQSAIAATAPFIVILLRLLPGARDGPLLE